MSHFNEVAIEWDSKFKIEMMKKLADESMATLSIKDPVDIMDFGCGTGLFGLEFEPIMRSLLGVDVSEGMLEIFDKKTEGAPNVRSIHFNLEESELEESFDLIVSAMAFHHLSDPLSVLRKLKKSLR